MIGGARVVAVVPARAGSKAIPRKNLQTVGGRTLVRRAVEAALGAPEVDRVIVSTDGAEIAEEARRAGAEAYDRAPALAGDDALVRDVLVDLRARLRAEGETAAYMTLLEPTATMRLSADVSACLRRMARDGLDSVATFSESEHHPHRAWRLVDGRPQTFIPGAVPWTPRQKLPPSWRLNGVVYAFRMDGLIEYDAPGLLFGACGAEITPPERALDIDTWIDLRIANAIEDSAADRA
jgi:CMP-N-acetylneuraminic acid synthetase